MLFRPRTHERPFEEVFLQHRGRNTIKWEHYLEAYHRHFKQFVKKKPVVLEIGVMQGGSLQIWKKYFGAGSTVVGIDINPRTRRYEEPGIEIHIGSQADAAFLDGVARGYGGFDIVIDDGSHKVDHQRAAMEVLWPHLREPGVYLCEDVHTSYFTRFGGGYRRPGTFIEMAKNLVDALNARWTGRLDRAQVEKWTDPLHSIHFYPAMVFFEKRKHDKVRLVRITEGRLEIEPVRRPLFGQASDPSG